MPTLVQQAPHMCMCVHACPLQHVCSLSQLKPASLQIATGGRQCSRIMPQVVTVTLALHLMLPISARLLPELGGADAVLRQA